MASTAAFPAAAPAQTTTAPNPGLEARCGLKVMLVLDESYSIDVTPNAMAGVRAAATSFVTALQDTGTTVGITAFSGRARLGVPYQEVDEVTVDTFKRWIDNAAGTNGLFSPPTNQRTATNWQDAFEQVNRVAGDRPDLVVFVTDGDPNTVTNANGTITTDTSQAGVTAALNAAVGAANAVKGNPSHIFAIGVGAAVNNEASAARLRAVSGENRFPEHSDFSTADYTLVGEFDGLKSSLTGIVARLCGSSLIVTKLVSEPPGEPFTEAPGWRFTATLDPTPGHTWLEPASAGTDRSASVTTGNDGLATFHWRLRSAIEKASLRVVRETVQPGFHFVLANCQTHHLDGTITARDSTTRIPGAELGREEFRTCQVYNAGPGAHLTVVKRLIPSTDPGRFDLLVNGIARVERVGDGGTTGRLLLGLGTHTVRERVTAAQAGTIALDQYAIRTRCVNRTTGRTVASSTGGRRVRVRLREETDDVVCTITNRRAAEPPSPPEVIPSPGPPVVPPPCGEADDECVTAAAGRARLTISKRMPARARVGRRVAIRLTVRNVGEQTARRVRLHETPPGGGRIVRVAGARATRRADGTVRWNLGSLAPGATRTVRATMLVGRAGLLRNTAVADADNAAVVFDRASLRVAAPPVPRITG